MRCRLGRRLCRSLREREATTTREPSKMSSRHRARPELPEFRPGQSVEMLCLQFRHTILDALWLELECRSVAAVGSNMLTSFPSMACP